MRKILLFPLLRICFAVINQDTSHLDYQKHPSFKNNVKASEKKLTVSVYAEDQPLPFNFVNAQLQRQIEISGILRKAENVQLEDDVVARDEDEYSCLDYGDQTTA